MGNLTIATIFIVMVNILLFFSSLAMTSIDSGGGSCYNIEGSIIEQSVNGAIETGTLGNDIENQLPEAQGTVTAGDSTNIFTDIFNSVLGWFKKAPGIKYVYQVVSAPYNMFKCTGLPNEFVIGIGVLWYLVTFLILVAFFWGRD